MPLASIQFWSGKCVQCMEPAACYPIILCKHSHMHSTGRSTKRFSTMDHRMLPVVQLGYSYLHRTREHAPNQYCTVAESHTRTHWHYHTHAHVLRRVCPRHLCIRQLGPRRHSVYSMGAVAPMPTPSMTRGCVFASDKHHHTVPCISGMISGQFWPGEKTMILFEAVRLIIR